MYLKNEGDGDYAAYNYLSNYENVAGIIYGKKEDTPTMDFTSMEMLLKHYMAWTRNENFNFVFYDLNGTFKRREIRSIGRNYNSNTLKAELGSS